MKAHQKIPHAPKSGMLITEVVVVIGSIGSVLVWLMVWAMENRTTPREQTIMHVRNCQQAMRGQQNMMQLKAGDAFTRKDLEQFMMFPENIKVNAGVIKFGAGDEKIKPESGDPAVNGNHLWLQVEAPKTKDYVGKYGFNNIADTTGW